MPASFFTIAPAAARCCAQSRGTAACSARMGRFRVRRSRRRAARAVAANPPLLAWNVFTPQFSVHDRSPLQAIARRPGRICPRRHACGDAGDHARLLRVHARGLHDPSALFRPFLGPLQSHCSDVRRCDELCVDHQLARARDVDGDMASVVAGCLLNRRLHLFWALNEAPPWSSHYDLIQAARSARAELARHLALNCRD